MVQKVKNCFDITYSRPLTPRSSPGADERQRGLPGGPEEGPGVGAEPGLDRPAQPRLVPRHHPAAEGRGADGRGRRLPHPRLHLATGGLRAHVPLESALLPTLRHQQGMSLPYVCDIFMLLYLFLFL